MSFASELLRLSEAGTGPADLRATIRRCFFYDFDGMPVRLWDGQGVLVTSTPVGDALTFDGFSLAANEWIGTIDASEVNHHNVPPVYDGRDGTSPRYDFTIPRVDAASYAAMKRDRSLAVGREITCYHALIDGAEGLRPQTPIGFAWRMTMRGVTFAEQTALEGSTIVKSYRVSVLARSLTHARSRVPNGTMTDTAQNARAQELGLSSDSGCVFVAGNANRTFTIGG